MQGENVNKERILLDKRDYEYYSFPIPINALFLRTREKYLVSQLGKMHPCFSDDWLYDTSFFLSFKGLKAKVVVINKMTLLEYKQKYLRRKLFVNEGKISRVFDEKKYFKSALFLTILLIVLIAIFSLLTLWVKNNKLEEEVDALEVGLESKKELIEEIEKNKESPLYYSIFDYFFPLVLENQGKVINLNWEKKVDIEKLYFTIEGVFPERFESQGVSLETEGLTFSNNIPSFEGTLECFVKSEEENNFEYKVEEKERVNILRKELRNCLLENKASLLEEGFSPIYFAFSCGREESYLNMDLFNQIGKILKECKCSLSKINIRKEGDSRLVFQFWFSKEYDFYCEKLMQLLQNNINIFFKEDAEKKDLKKVEDFSRVENPVTENEIDGVKIGVIKKVNSPDIYVYKMKSGKIQMVKSERKNER